MRRLLLLIFPVVFLVTGLAVAATFLLVRSARSSHSLRSYLAAHFTSRPDCPLPNPFVEPSVGYDCFDGRLPSGAAVALVLGNEPGSRATVWSYIGVFVPGAPAATIAPFAARVRARGDLWGRRAGGQARTHLFIPPPESEPVRADALTDGVFVAWRFQTLPSLDKLESRLAEIDAALRAAPGPAPPAP